MDEAETLAKSTRAVMVAPAGHGKTEIIATSVARYGGRRELVLTHTHAGVDALRVRLAKFGVRVGACQLDTIAGWVLRTAAAFPGLSGISTLTPRHSDEHASVCRAASTLLGLTPMREIMRASYSGVYVDEYQDCTVDQHAVVVGLGAILPCRIVGDPLQGIFDFGSNKPVDWTDHVLSTFMEIPASRTPWRWVGVNPDLGKWLSDVRERLSCGGDVDLRTAPSSVQWLEGGTSSEKRQRQIMACRAAARSKGDTVIAIHQWRQQCHAVASRLNGLYSCVEPIDEQDLYDACGSLDDPGGFTRAVALLDFVGKCVTRVNVEFRTIRNALAAGRIPRVQKYRAELESLLALGSDLSTSVVPALRMLARVGVVYRQELLREMERAVTSLLVGEASTLADAAWLVRNRTRQRGRSMWRHSVGTTLLVKGLQFDHAVVLDADMYDSRNLYVALTRASKSLTVISRHPVIRPRSPGRC